MGLLEREHPHIDALALERQDLADDERFAQDGEAGRNVRYPTAHLSHCVLPSHALSSR
jgi:hypothetical protein